MNIRIEQLRSQINQAQGQVNHKVVNDVLLEICHQLLTEINLLDEEVMFLKIKVKEHERIVRAGVS